MDDSLELVDFGDAMEETKQCAPGGVFMDSYFWLGTHEWQGGIPPQCP